MSVLVGTGVGVESVGTPIVGFGAAVTAAVRRGGASGGDIGVAAGIGVGVNGGIGVGMDIAVGSGVRDAVKAGV